MKAKEMRDRIKFADNFNFSSRFIRDALWTEYEMDSTTMTETAENARSKYTGRA